MSERSLHPTYDDPRPSGDEPLDDGGSIFTEPAEVYRADAIAAAELVPDAFIEEPLPPAPKRARVAPRIAAFVSAAIFWVGATWLYVLIYAGGIVDRWFSGWGLLAGALTAVGIAGVIRFRSGSRASLWLSVAWLVMLAFLATFADLLPFVKSYQRISADLAQAPSADHWFGTDQLGRDIFTRVVYGARVSLAIGVIAVVFGIIVGGLLGMVSGYYRGRLESVIMSAMDVMLAFPALILALAIVTFLGRDTINIVMALAILSIPPLTRIVRANTLVFSQREFVLAARALGAKNGRIIFKEVMPNVIPPMVSFSLIAIAVVIVAEGALAFLGLSVQPPIPTWGFMINEGREELARSPWMSLLPATTMFATILSLNLLGDIFTGRFQVKESGL